jgi:hypothetical protein
VDSDIPGKFFAAYTTKMRLSTVLTGFRGFPTCEWIRRDGFDVDDLIPSRQVSTHVADHQKKNSLKHLEQAKPQPELALDFYRKITKDKKTAICRSCQLPFLCGQVDISTNRCCQCPSAYARTKPTFPLVPGVVELVVNHDANCRGSCT